MRALRRYFYRIINFISYRWYKFIFAINYFIDDQIINQDEILRSKIKGVAVSTGRRLDYEGDSVEASAQRKHKFQINREDVEVKAPNIQSAKGSASKIIHVVNLFLPSPKNKSLCNRTNLTLQSIEKAVTQTAGVELLGCSSIALKRPGWNTRILIRNAANTIGHTKDFLYLIDMLDAAAELAGDEDYILYSNLDCMLTLVFTLTFLKIILTLLSM